MGIGKFDGSRRPPVDASGRRRRLRVGLRLAVLGVAVAAAAACDPPAELVLAVNSTLDGSDAVPGDGACATASGTCTLRAAVDEANATDAGIVRVEVPPATYDLAAGPAEDLNASGDLDAGLGGAELHIEGAPYAVLDGSHAGAVIDVRPGTPVHLSDLGIVGSSTAAVRVRSGGSMAMARVAVTGNPGVALNVAGSAVVSASTISGNGGAGINGSGDVVLAWSTVSGNAGGGIAGSADVLVAGSALAGGGANPACNHALSSNGDNADADGTCGLSAPSDHPNVALGLGPLTVGVSPHQVPQAGSPLVDAAACPAPAPTDQIGQARPLGGSCDIGAVERGGGLWLGVDRSTDAPDATPGDGVCAVAGGGCTLRAAIREANLSPGSDTIGILPWVNPATTIAGANEDANATGDLDVAGDLSIVGLHVVRNQIIGNDLDRVLHHLSGTLVVHHVEITWGKATTKGSGIRTHSALEIHGSKLVRNLGTAAIFGGAASNVTVERSELEDNPVGGIATDGAVTIRSSIVTGGRSGEGIRGAGAIDIERSTISRLATGVVVAGPGPVTIRSSSIVDNSNESSNMNSVTVVGIAGSSGVAATVDIRNSTIGYNRRGASLTGTNTTFTIGGTVLAGWGDAPLCSATSVVSLGFNVASDLTCALTGTGDVNGVDPKLDRPGSGGARRLLTGSEAMDRIPAGTVGLCEPGAVDQLGAARPSGPACDSGAVEGAVAAVSGSYVVTSGTDEGDALRGDGVCLSEAGGCTLRAAVDESLASSTSDTITFDAGLDPVLVTPPWRTVVDDADNSNYTADLDVTGPASGDLAIVGDADGTTIDLLMAERAIDGRGASVRLERLSFVRSGGPFGQPRSPFVYNGGKVEVVSSTIHPITADLRDVSPIVYGRKGTTVLDSDLAATRTPGSTGIFGADSVRAGTGPVLIERSYLEGPVELGETGFPLPTATIRSSTVNGTVRVHDLPGAATQIVGSTVMHRLTGRIVVSGSVLDVTALNASASGACASNGPVTSGGYNVVSDDSCGFAGPTDQQGVLAFLTPPADNGGSSRSVLLAANSPAIDEIPAGTPGLCDGTTPPDQRGAPRPAGGACDVGAVEGAGPALVPIHLTVTRAADLPDLALGNGTCEVAGGGCSLRAAVTEANANGVYVPGIVDEITLAPGVNPTLTIAGAAEDGNATGDVDSIGGITIHGGGSTIATGALDRILDVRGGPLTVEDATLTGGSVAGSGGALFGTGPSVSLSGVSLDGNQATDGDGGAVWARVLTMTDTTVTGNAASRDGGGAFASSAATIDGAVIAANTAGRNGGGVNAPTVSIQDTRITGNGAAWGGGLYLAQNGATALVERSTVDGNAATATGGGLYLGSQITLRQVTISGNSANGAGGAGALDLSVFSGAVLELSTVTGNTGARSITTYLAPPPQYPWLPVSSVALHGTVVVPAAGSVACSQAAVVSTYVVAVDGTCGTSLPGTTGLGALTDNGGVTPTQLPDAGTAMVDAIPVGTAGLCDGTVPSDQRGVARPQGAACDVGAVER